MIENFVSGDTLEHLFNKDISNSLNLIRQAFEKLLQFYSSQMFSYISADKYIFQLTNELEKYRQLFSVDKYLNDFVKLIKFLVKEEKWAEKNIAVVLLHGDFCLKNILWSRDKASLHFIDWEFCREGSVLYDFFHLICCIDYARLPETVNRHPDDSFNECMIEILDEFSNRFNLDSKSVRIMSYIFLAERVLFTLKLFEENKILAKVTDEIKQWHELMETLVMAMPSSSEYSKLKRLNGGKIISYA
jgi:thiamine kinase-like enzyme